MDDPQEFERYSVEEALAMLASGRNVHTFRAGALGLIGADWDRDKIVSAIREYGGAIKVGPEMTGMGHALAMEDKHGMLFIATKEEGNG